MSFFYGVFSTLFFRVFMLRGLFERNGGLWPPPRNATERNRGRLRSRGTERNGGTGVIPDLFCIVMFTYVEGDGFIPISEPARPVYELLPSTPINKR